ncbi:hypothetical protein BMETH_637_0 [methanotrophic bacterial endosymbiont of Bathymodiolus sp.]|nr:hypothetical protein BMETH_637_0 [methanotrophic bacterial endosymbiont of Bathymodiolus sp.]
MGCAVTTRFFKVVTVVTAVGSASEKTFKKPISKPHQVM